MLFMDLNVDCVDALLNIIPGEKLLALGKSLSSLFDKCVSIPEAEYHGEFQNSFMRSNESLLSGPTWCCKVMMERNLECSDLQPIYILPIT